MSGDPVAFNNTSAVDICSCVYLIIYQALHSPTFRPHARTNDTVATSALGSFTISSTSVPSGSTISKIVVTSTKSSGSSGNIELFVAKDEDNGDGTFDRYTDSKSWNSSLTFADFGNYNLSPVGNYYVQFESTRYSTGTVAAATLKNIYVTVYYH